MKTKLTFLIIAAALAAATAGRAQTVISYSTDGGAQALETGSVRQTVLDTATLEVSYRMEWLRHPDSKEPMLDLLLLQAGGKVTKFFSYKTLQRDSLLRITPTEQVLANVGNFKGGLEAVVFQNYPAGELTCTDKISRDNMLYTEPLPEIEWTLRDGTREVIGYDCRRATCRFRGRDYEAWYTEELPLATGPWKFHGLPGLILAVTDTGDDGGIIRFEATGIRRAEVPVTMADLNYLKTSRKKFMEMYFHHPMCDLGDVSKNTTDPKEWQTEKKTIKEHLDYKFILALEGNDVASNLKWVMSSNSIAVMPQPTCETWFMEGTLIPNYHYIEIKPDFSDLESRLQYYIEHIDEAQEIIKHANEYVKQFKNRKRENLISLLVLEKYFKVTGQHAL